MEVNLVEYWLRFDPVRWISGVLAGLLAGAVAVLVAMVACSSAGMDFWFPIKLIAAIALGPTATEYAAGANILLTGIAIFGIFCGFLGLVYAHFTVTNMLCALLGIGIVWGAFSWVFIWNLFLQSFRVVFAAQISAGIPFLICMVFGVCLASVRIFDQVLRA